MNPTDQFPVRRLCHEHDVARTGEQASEARAHRFARYRIPKLAGKTRYLRAIPLSPTAYMKACHILRHALRIERLLRCPQAEKATGRGVENGLFLVPAVKAQPSAGQTSPGEAPNGRLESRQRHVDSRPPTHAVHFVPILSDRPLIPKLTALVTRDAHAAGLGDEKDFFAHTQVELDSRPALAKACQESARKTE